MPSACLTAVSHSFSPVCLFLSQPVSLCQSVSKPASQSVSLCQAVNALMSPYLSLHQDNWLTHPIVTKTTFPQAQNSKEHSISPAGSEKVAITYWIAEAHDHAATAVWSQIPIASAGCTTVE